MKRRVLKAFVSTMVAASLLSQTAMAAVVSEEIPGSVSGETSSENISGSEEMQTEPIPEQPGEVEEIPETAPEEGQENLPESGADEIPGVMAEGNDFIPDSVSPNIVVDWKFDSDYFKSGSLATNDLVIWDASGNGNNLQLNTQRAPQDQNAASYMSFGIDSISGAAETESLQMGPSSGNKKEGAFFETVTEAPMNEEEFTEGYTIEAIIKVPYNVSAWSSVFGQKGTGKLAGMQGGRTGIQRRVKYFRFPGITVESLDYE